MGGLLCCSIVYIFFNPYYFLSVGEILYLPPLKSIWDFLCLIFSFILPSTLIPLSSPSCFSYLGFHHLGSSDNIITQIEYKAEICKVMSSFSVVATKGYVLRQSAVIFPYLPLLMYIQRR